MVATGRHRYRYVIDANDFIASVNDSWLAFARENGAGELTREFVVGRSLWEFVQGETTRLLYQQLVRQIRAEGTRMVIPFRCDSPSVQRDMRLEIKQTTDGKVQFDGVLVSVKPRSYLAVLDARVPRTSDSLTMCSCCKSAFVQTMGWLKLEDAVVHSKCFETDSAPRLRYSLCPECALTLTD